MEYVSGIVTGFVTEVGKLLFCAVGQQIWGMYKFKSIVQKLQKQEEDIKDRKERVERRGDTIEPEVLTWLAKAEDFTTRLENISNEENKQCFKGCRNLKTRFIDSKEAVKLLNECDRLLALGYFPRTAQSSVPERTRSRYVKEDHKFDSRESVFEKVMQTLKSTDIKAIGVYGMGGVGKTTLVKKVYIQAKEDRLFDEVLMAEVTQKPDPIKIQGALADDLGLVLRDESVRGRADRLHAHLKKEKSVLVILDDVWEKLDLDVVGIPVKEYSQRDCKLVLTSRDQRVCTDMETEEQIEIRPLHLEEAVELFWGIVNDSIKRSQFEVLATQIVKNCSCLPIAVSAIAKALKNEGSSSWDDALNMVRGMNFRGAEDKVISVIELSYELLKNKDAQNLFLLCSLHKIGHSIGTDDLVKHAIGLNLFQYDNRVKDVRRKVDKLIKDLKDASLLLEDDKEDSVKVHDVIHVVAQKIASRSDQRMFNLHGVDDLEEKLDMGMYKDSKAISLPSVDIQELPQMPELPKLEFLLLSSQRKYSFWVENPLLEIPNSFFDRMKEMKVLVLTGVKLLSLNPSLGHLRNLQSLCLEHCDLEDIRTVGKLDKLEVFSFSHSNIEKLPEEIGDLARLKLLDLEHCRHLEVIPPNVLSKLTKLEELYMGDTSVKWDAQDNASLNELNQLKRLTILNIHIMDARIIPEDLFLGKLERCVLCICKEWGWFSKSGNSRILSLALKNENDLRGGVKKFFKKIEELYLDELVGFRNVYPQLGEEGFPNVKCLCAKNAPNISHIVMQEEHDSYNAFPMLESLSLCNLINLERICHGHLRVEFFSKLKGIEVSECDALTYLISSSTAKISFSNLQEIVVADCKVLENIFGNESDEDSVCIELPKLHSITLYNLPKLTTFGPTKSTATREIVPEEDDEDLITLFGRNVSFPRLKNLTIKRCNVNTLFHKKIVLTALDTLELSSVTGMEYVFTMSVASSLVHLQKLTVRNCANMKEIVIEGAVNTPAIEETLFPKLNRLCLEGLPKLKRFCCFSGHAIKLASVSNSEIRSCPNTQKFVSNPLSVSLTPNLKLKEMNPEENLFADTIPLFDEKVSFPSLKNLTIKRCNVNTLFHKKQIVLTVLDTLELSSVNGMEYLFTMSVASSLVHLRELTVRNCADMKEIVIEGAENDPSTNDTQFPKLHKLYLEYLPELKMFCSFSGHAIKLASLSQLKIQSCPKMQKFVFDPLSVSLTPNLNPEEMDLEENLFADAIPLFDEKILLPHLKSLGIHRMHHLRRLWHNVLCPTSFCSLESLTVASCKKLCNVFLHNMLDRLQRLEKLTIYDCNSLEEIFDVPEGSSRMEKNMIHIIFPKLTVLELVDLEKLKSFYHELHISKRPSLKRLIVGNRCNVEILGSEFQILCEEKQSVPQPLFIVDKVSFPSLKNLTLSSLKIPNIWCNQLPSSYSFGETLTSLNVGHCPHLKFLFSSSMVNSLEQLHELRVANCGSMEVIINKEGSSGENNFNSISFFDEKVCDSVEELFDVSEGSSGMEGNTIPMIIFPKLTKLTLSSLPNLKSFYNGLHISEWPSLKELRVESCDKVEVFGSKYQSLCEENQSVPQPLFIVGKDAFPRLEELTLIKNDNLNEIWHGGRIISKTLKFWGKTNIIKFPHYLLATDTLDIPFGYFKQIGGGSDNTFAAALRQLRTLIVKYGDDDDSLDKYFESTDSLACLVSSWVSFQNLTNLEITRINSGFIYLLTHSTAISLQHLTRLKISYCNNIEAIIMPPTDEVNDKIVFSQLKYLELHNLESLTSFYSGSHTLEFPSLEKMVVDKCPKMKVFSEGDSITPVLHSIQLEQYGDDDKRRLEGDVNNTIQKMFKEMVGFKGLEELRLSKFPHLKEIWHGQIPFGLFDDLDHLTVDKCADMSSAIPLNLLPCLESLYRLTIEDCDSLEEVIHMEGLDVDDQSVLLPKLTRIQLIELPRLRNVWSKNHLEILGFTNLKRFFVSKCNSLRYIFTTTIILSLKQLKEVEIRDCAMVETIIIEDRGNDASTSDIVVPKLRFIVLESLPKLTCFHSRSNVLECSSLKTMTINDCPQMKTFVFTSAEDHDLQDTPLFNEKVAFPNVAELKLSKLPMAEHLWTEPCRAFQHLATVEISECVNLKSLVPSSASLPSLKTLEISECHRLTSLVTLPTAKSLEQLAKINVASCKIMREIITHIHVGDEENDRVVFGQLKYIGLHCLPNITGFYLGEYTTEFLALEQVVVRQCQKMNTFSKGIVSTPKLKRVQLTNDEEEGRWENDLNTTVQLLFEETNAQSQKEG